MTKLYVKYDNSGSWDTVSGAKDIKVTKAMDFKDDASFSLPNYFNEVYSTWAARTDVGIQVWVDTDVDYMIFQGQITQVIAGDPLSIKCLGVADKLDWYPVPEGATKYKIDELKIKNAPGASPDVTLNVWTEEEEDPDYNSSDYLGKFIIVSDATLEESNAVMLSEAGSSLVNESDSDNAHGNTQTDDPTTNEGEWEADCWIVEQDKVKHNTGNPTKMILELDAVNDTITKASDVTKIKIEMKGRIWNRAYGADFPSTTFTATCGWSIDGATIDIPLFSVTSPKPDAYSATVTEFRFIGDELSIIVEPGKTSDYFNEGANFWEDGYIIIQLEYTGATIGTTRAISHKIYVNYLKVTTYYNSEEFDPISGKITQIGAAAGYNVLWADDADGNAIDWADRGMAVGDRVTIAEDMNTAFQKCLVGPLSDKPQIDVPDNIFKGIANEYYGISGHKLFITFCAYMGYSYWASYDTVIPRIIANFESDINNNIISGDTVASVAGDAITLTDLASVDDDQFNGNIVYVTAGDQIGETFVILDTDNATGKITFTTTPNGNLVGDTIDIRYADRIYDTDNDPPDALGIIESQNNNYGGVVVYCNAGVTEIIRSGAAPYNEKINIIVRKDVLTIQEAREIGARWASRLKNKKISIKLDWHYLPVEFPAPGKLYTYTGRVWDGTDHTTEEEFADEVCRRVTVSQDGAKGLWEISAFFGGGQTPVDEALGKAIGDLRVVNLLDQASAMTTTITGVQRHGQLDGITPTQHHTPTVAADLDHDDIANPQGNANEQHLTAAQVAALHTAVVAGDLDHDDIANPQGNANEQHLTAAQVAALHAAVVAGDLNHNDLANIDAGDINHLTDVQVAALHAIADYDADIGIGAANTFWISLLPSPRQAAGANYGHSLGAAVWSNLGATDHWVYCYITIPMVLPSGKELYLKTLKYGVLDADGGDKINRTFVRNTYNNAGTPTQTTFIDNNPVSYGAANTVYTEDYSGAPFNLHTNDGVHAYCQFQVFSTTAGDFDLAYIIAELYYA